MANILMPKATAVWLIDNTTLSFEQIADFCELHRLEVQGIADGEVAQNMRGSDPVAGGELTREEIARGEADTTYRLKMSAKDLGNVQQPKRKGARYTPVARRQDKPDAIAWFLYHHKEVTDAQISKLIGTTKATINGVRDRTHWNTQNIKPVDPVTLGLCSQIELDELIAMATERHRKLAAKRGEDIDGPSLAAVEDMPVPEEAPAENEGPSEGDMQSYENDPDKLFNL